MDQNIQTYNNLRAKLGFSGLAGVCKTNSVPPLLNKKIPADF